MPMRELRPIPQEMHQPAHRQALPGRFHVWLVVRKRRRRRPRWPLRQGKPEFQGRHAVVDIVDDRAAEDLDKAGQMIWRFIVIATRRMSRARPGQSRQKMDAVPMSGIKSTLVIAPAETEDGMTVRRERGGNDM